MRRAENATCRIPSNLRFKVPQDYESPWLLGEGSFDLIHLRTGCGSVSSWPDLYQKVFEYVTLARNWSSTADISNRGES